MREDVDGEKRESRALVAVPIPHNLEAFRSCTP
jgi:hypothetical protein